MPATTQPSPYVPPGFAPFDAFPQPLPPAVEALVEQAAGTRSVRPTPAGGDRAVPCRAAARRGPVRPRPGSGGPGCHGPRAPSDSRLTPGALVRKDRARHVDPPQARHVAEQHKLENQRFVDQSRPGMRRFLSGSAGLLSRQGSVIETWRKPAGSRVRPHGPAALRPAGWPPSGGKAVFPSLALVDRWPAVHRERNQHRPGRRSSLRVRRSRR